MPAGGRQVISAAPARYLLLFICFSACAQYDSGALAAMEKYMREEMSIATSVIGLINATEYVLLPLASPLLIWLLRRYHAKPVLLWCLQGNLLGVLCICFAIKLTGSYLLAALIASRCLSGFCHAGIAVYGNVWVDLFAPKSSAASWMGAMQASSLVGLVLGYGFAGYSKDWQSVFGLNIVWFLMVFLCLAWTPRRFIGDEAAEATQDSHDKPLIEAGSAVFGSAVMSPSSRSFLSIHSSPNGIAETGPEAPENVLLACLMSLAVSSLFFVSGGLQFWVTPYMMQLRTTGGFVDEDAGKLITSLVIIITLTAPTTGVLIGGLAVDLMGGYRTVQGRRRCLMLLTWGALLVGAFGVAACYSTDFWVAVVCFWFFDGLGAALLPGSMGLMMAAVRPQRRAIASAMSQIMINLLGMAAGGFLPGLLAGCDPTKEAETGLDAGSNCNYATGLRSLLLGPIVGLIAIVASLLLPARPHEGSLEEDSTELAGQRPRHRSRRCSSFHTVVIGVIDQIDGKAGTMVLRLEEEISFPVLLARAAICTGNPTRRLFMEDGSEIRSTAALVAAALAAADASPARHQIRKSRTIDIDLEILSTDGSDFRWKWGRDHAHYHFGDLIVRPALRRLLGSNTMRAVKHPPGPFPLPTSGNLKDALPDMWLRIFPLCEKYGPIVKMRIFDDVVYIIADPDAVEEVSQIADKRIPKQVFGIKTIACEGIFIADGQRWEFGRHALQGNLMPEAIDALVPNFAKRARRMTELLMNVEGPVDMFDWVERATMDSICDVGFGHDLGTLDHPGEENVIVKTFDEVLEVSINSALYGVFDFTGHKKQWYKVQSDKLNVLLDDIITAAREGRQTGAADSLLHKMIDARCPLTQRSFDQSELRDQLLTLLVAGHKTSTLLLTWAIYHVGSQPQVEEKLVHELREVFGEDMDREPTPQDIRKLKYLDMVVREVLRLCAPVQVAQRGLTQSVKVGEYTLVPGGHSGKGHSWIAIHIMGISQSKKYWGEDHLEFRPERFEPQNAAKFHPWQYIPFGGGRRLCIGNLFALGQTKAIMATLMRRFHFRTIPGRPVKIDPFDLATPLHAEKGGGVWLHLIKRSSWQQERPGVTVAQSFGNLTAAVLEQRREEDERERHVSGSPLLVLWGGEFGTTETAAMGLRDAATRIGFEVELRACNEVNVSDLGQKHKLVVCLVATYNGYPPPNALEFHRDLKALQAQAIAAKQVKKEKQPSATLKGHNDDGGCLSSLRFAVLGVGNSNWVSTFGKVGQEIDAALAACGAKCALPFEVVDRNETFEKHVTGWRRVLLDTLAGADRDNEEPEHAEAPPSFLTLEACPEKAAAIGFTGRFLQQMGYQSCEVTLRKELCSEPPPGSPESSALQIRIVQPGASPSCCGDHLEVYPQNSPQAVKLACDQLASPAGNVVIVRSQKSGGATTKEAGASWLGQAVRIGDLLTHVLDLSATPSQEVLAALVLLAQSAPEANAIRKLTSVKESNAYVKWCQQGHSLIDALAEWPSVRIDLARFVELCPRLRPRLYSIASSHLAVGTSLELCCKVVSYTAQGGTIRHGICSTMLSTATAVHCKVKEAPYMRMPNDATTSIACVCGGTGIAPFLGFLQERASQQAAGVKVGLVHLYFGCRGDYDCLHEAQLRAWEEQGLCRLCISHSRRLDQEPEYVYHTLECDTDFLLMLLSPEGSGRLYLCGAAATLAKDCTRVLAKILGKGDPGGGMSSLTNLQQSGRIVFDVWG